MFALGTVGFGEVMPLPVVFGYSNPYYAKLFNLNYASATLGWLAMLSTAMTCHCS